MNLKQIDIQQKYHILIHLIGLDLVLIVFSFALYCTELAVKADDTITVTASVPAPLPTIPPVITSPTDNSKIFTSTVMVSAHVRY